MERYYPRIADQTLAFKLRSCGAVWIKGPKWCGKSTTAEQVAKSAAYLQDRSTSAQQIALAKNAPELFLAGESPKLIDEWQVVPFIWDQIRYEVDHRDKMGQFIITGSATPLDDDDDAREHSGIGRITPMIMRPMSLWESDDSTGGISLSRLFSGETPGPAQSRLGFRDYAFLTCRGGWPSALGLADDAALEQAYIFYNGLVEDDLKRVLKNKRNPERVRRLMRSLARAVSSEMPIATIRKDMIANDNDAMDVDTIASYLNALERLYVVENLAAWNPNLRSKTAVRTSETRHLVDPSISCAALGLGPGDLLADLKTFGLLFESLCVRDLRIFTEALHGEVRHYRDSGGLEADAVLRLRGGAWAAVEVKLASEDSIDEGAEHLRRLAAKVEGRGPEFLMVLSATGVAYKRADGVWVVPLGCLEP
ncbi:ATP-binding protein [Coriobacteriales bacterium OH1046]|nr:ATP-binding protein [Coriobacteriales bacterium OH1046]